MLTRSGEELLVIICCRGENSLNSQPRSQPTRQVTNSRGFLSPTHGLFEYRSANFKAETASFDGNEPT